MTTPSTVHTAMDSTTPARAGTTAAVLPASNMGLRPVMAKKHT